MKTSQNKRFWVLGVLGALALTTGVALAMQTVTIDLPAGEHVVVNAAVLVAEGGATVYTTVRPRGEGTDIVDFSVVFDEASGTVTINGGAGVGYDPGTVHQVTAVCREVAGSYEVDIEVRDALGGVIASLTGAEMGGVPSQAVATAADVISLTAE